MAAAAQPVKTITIAGVKISQLSVVVLVSSFVLALAMLFVGPMGFLGSLTVLLAGALAAYNVNCVQVGHCQTWALILTVFYVINSVIIVVAGVSLKSFLGGKGIKGFKQTGKQTGGMYKKPYGK